MNAWYMYIGDSELSKLGHVLQEGRDDALRNVKDFNFNKHLLHLFLEEVTPNLFLGHPVS